jgi:type VI secretion system ImpC/EvpB family protein
MASPPGTHVDGPEVTSPDPQVGRGSGLAAARGGNGEGQALAEAAYGTRTAPGSAGIDLDGFLCEPSADKALALWVRQAAPRQERPSKRLVTRLLSRDIARIDALLSEQVNAIIHHPAFQRLEASWRGLFYLVDKIDEGQEAKIKVKVLNVAWKEVTRDLERAIEFDQSQLFRKVYSEEFGTPGGEPYGVILGDYEIWKRPAPDHPTDDIGALVGIGAVAAAAFAPFLASVHPSLLDLESFSELERLSNIARTFEQTDFMKWRVFRQTEDARFVGLLLPRVVLRQPYQDSNIRVDRFRFREDVGAPDRSQYLWGNAVYIFGGVLARAFAESSWPANIRGVPDADISGGVVADLPGGDLGTDKPGIAPRCATDVMITDFQEKELSDLGFIPLCHCAGTDRAAFYGCQSVQRPKKFDEPAATANAKLSAMLHYLLCVSRFAHYLKVIARDKIGGLTSAEDVQDYLHKWLVSYTVSMDEADLGTKARFPLRDGRVQIREHPAKPGNYLCVIHLQPHFQIDQVVTAVRLTTELSAASG